MFWIINRTFLATCLIILDVLLLINIQNKKNSTVVITEKPKTITFIDTNSTSIGTKRIIIPKSQITKPPTSIRTPTRGVEIAQNNSRSDLNSGSNQGPSLVMQNSTSDLLQQINNFRGSKGLGTIQTDPYTCAFANTRAAEITSAFNHDGFSSRLNSKSLPYPSYSEITENIAMNSDKNAVIQGWIDSPGHNENMLKNTPYACIGKSGDYYVYESWRP